MSTIKDVEFKTLLIIFERYKNELTIDFNTNDLIKKNVKILYYNKDNIEDIIQLLKNLNNDIKIYFYSKILTSEIYQFVPYIQPKNYFEILLQSENHLFREFLINIFIS